MYQITEFMHQGDVLFLKVEKIVEELGEEYQLDHKKGYILQHGEALGHYHTIPVDQADSVVVRALPDLEGIKQMGILVKDAVQVLHEEHAPVTLTPGSWIARTQREHTRGMVRPVID